MNTPASTYAGMQMPHPLPDPLDQTPPTPDAPASEAASSHGHHLPAVIEIGHLRGTVWRALRMFVEAIAVPTVLLAVLLHTSGLVPALAAAMGWCVLTVVLRWVLGRQLPGTLLLGVLAVFGRSAVALATSSAVVYLLQPAIGSGLTALLFIGSAAIGRPITLRLARDFVTLPEHVLTRRDVRRMFAEVAVLFGVSRLIDAAMTVGALHWGVDGGLLSRGILSPTLTLLTIAACTAWGWRSMRRAGITLRLARGPAVTPVA